MNYQPLFLRIEQQNGNTYDVNSTDVSSILYSKFQGKKVAYIRFSNPNYEQVEVIGDEAINRLQRVIASNVQVITAVQKAEAGCLQPLPENLQRLQELAEKRELKQPITEGELRCLTLEEIKFYKSKLFDRVVASIDQYLNFIRDNHKSVQIKLQERLNFQWWDEGLFIGLDGIKVFDSADEDFVLGEWLDLVPEFFNQMKAEVTREKEVEESNSRDAFIQSLTGKKPLQMNSVNDDMPW